MIDKKLIEIYSHLLHDSITNLLKEDNSDDKIFSIEDLRAILLNFSINNSIVTSKLLNIDKEQLGIVNLTISRIIDKTLDCLKEEIYEIKRTDN